MESILADFSMFHPGLSVDCVIFGFHEGELKVLLLRMKNMDTWALPGGFILKNEDVDIAAGRVLKERTGVDKVFLKQFHLFGKATRSNPDNIEFLINEGIIDSSAREWFSGRFATIGYYALIDFVKATPIPDSVSDRCEWIAIDQIPSLMIDHRAILNEALEALRRELKYAPIGISLLPEKFTMPEIQTLYETILGKKLDRRNFQRKMLGFNYLIRHNQRKTGGAHRAPYLYSFDKVKYNQALATGLGQDW